MSASLGSYISHLFLAFGLIAGIIHLEKFSNYRINPYSFLLTTIVCLFFAALFQNLYHSDFSRLGAYGFTFYGGLTGLLICVFISHKFKLSGSLTLLNLLAEPALLAHGFWRIACYSGGCCYGIKINSILFDRFPVQLLESLLLFIGYFISRNHVPKSYMLAFYLLYYPGIRFFLEFLRDDARGFFIIHQLYPSQTISLLLFTMGLLCAVALRRASKKAELVRRPPLDFR